MILLIHPPVAKPCEPPAGLAQLAGVLQTHRVPYHILDLSLEGMLHLLTNPAHARDTWTRRAEKNISLHLASLRGIEVYRKFDSYKRAVLDINRLLVRSADHLGIRISLDNYEDISLSPARTGDLLRAADHPEGNPFHGYFSLRLREIIEEKQPLFIGFSLSYLSQALCTFAMIGFLRTHYPHIRIILGGGLITSWMNSPTWKDSFGRFVDCVVAGPGETPLLAILGKEGSARKAYRPVFTFDRKDQYLAAGMIMPYSTSSGCYWSKCTFCPERAEGSRYIQRAPRSVVRDLQSLVKDVEPALIHLTDNAVSPAVLRSMAENPPGAPWYGFTRISDYLTDPDFCIALRKSGCVMLKLGIESGDQGVLDAMHKGSDTLTASRTLRALSQAGIATYVYLLFGTPYESEKQARKTLEFIVKESSYIDFMNLAVFNLPLLSPDSSALERSEFYEGDLSLYSDFIHPKGWDRRKVRHFLDGEFKKHPAIRTILRKQPPFFTSNHAPLFTRGFLETMKGTK